MVKLVKVTHENIPQASEIFAQGFQDDPLCSFVFYQEDTRLEALTAYFQLFVKDNVERGEVLMTEGGEGAIAWYPESVVIFDDNFGKTVLEAAKMAAHYGGEKGYQRFTEMMEKFHEIEPQEQHLEVVLLAIKPEGRNQGLGKMLMAPVLDYLDRQQIKCYLVSSNPRNISFYQRQGFVKTDTVEADPTVSLTVLWRNPVLSSS